MTRIALLRHGLTAWNREGRLQGRTDLPLSAEGKAALAGRRLPAEWRGAIVYCSPLRRACETAITLGLTDFVSDPRLTEMDWGGYNGRTVAEIRAAFGAEMTENENRGLDFQPPGGESPRTVRERLADWLREVAGNEQDVVAITHKGIMRAMLSLACDWDMTGRQPVRLDWAALHVFRVGADGVPRPDRLNLPLDPA